MPLAALDQVTPDHLVPAAKVGALIGELARIEVPETSGDVDRQWAIMLMEVDGDLRPAEPTTRTPPLPAAEGG